MRLVSSARVLVLALVSTAFLGCGGGGGASAPGAGAGGPLPEIPYDANSFIVKSRFTAEISTDASGAMKVAAVGNPVNIPVTVINAPNVKVTFDTSGFVVPAVSNQVLSFGTLKLTELMDNNLKVCGADGKTRCSGAAVRMYTTGVAGSGVYSAADGWGAPIVATNAAGQSLRVGLGAENAAVVQSQSFANGKNVFRLSDFTSASDYGVSADFTDAGAGDYSTTLVIEFGLVP